MATVTIPEETAEKAGGQRLVLRGVEWSEYRKVSEAFSERHLRITYDRGTLELMTISSAHGRFGRLLARLVGALTEELGLPLCSCGDMTCDREDLDQGIEPDECSYIANEPIVREKEKIDMTIDPPPDLAVEIEITRSSQNRLGIYGALGVAEVWRFDGEVLTIHQRMPNGQYAVTEQSPQFPFLSATELGKFLQLYTQLEENALVRSFRDWVRKQIGKSK
jgi:Uma2 family endonuclease